MGFENTILRFKVINQNVSKEFLINFKTVLLEWANRNPEDRVFFSRIVKNLSLLNNMRSLKSADFKNLDNFSWADFDKSMSMLQSDLRLLIREFVEEGLDEESTTSAILSANKDLTVVKDCFVRTLNVDKIKSWSDFDISASRLVDYVEHLRVVLPAKYLLMWFNMPIKRK